MGRPISNKPARAVRPSTRAKKKTRQPNELDALRLRLAEAEETLQAIRNGDVDALVVTGDQGEQIYTLKDAARPYQVLVEEMNEGALTLSADGHILYANAQFAEMVGLALKKVLGESLAQFVAPADPARIPALLKQGLVERCRDEFTLATRKRALIPVQLSLRSIILDGVPRISALVSDLTERKRAEERVRQLNAELEQRVQERTSELETANVELAAEIATRQSIAEALQHSEQKANDLIRYAPTAIYEIDFRGPRFKSVNDAMCEMSGYSSEELLAMNPFDLLDAESQARFQSRINKTLAGEPIDGAVEYTVKVKDGSQRYAVLNTTMLYEAGKPIGAVVIAHDITARKQAEDKIRHLNRDLERHASELEMANRELEAFSYSVSHDLRAPLGFIQQFAHALIEESDAPLPPTSQRYLDLISDNAAAMSRLVEDLLLFSRTTRVPLHKQEVDMGAMVRDVWNELRQAAGERSVEFVLGAVPPAQADPTLLKQVWVNLISNALKFTRRCENARIEIGYDPHQLPLTKGEGEGVEGGAYFVKDNGVGFDMDQADRLFTVFQRLHSADDYEGTGVGLAIVERIVRRHGGHAWAFGAVDQGATFYFNLGRDT